MLERIESVFYNTRNLDRAIQWYTKVLGVKLRFRILDWAELETKGAALALHQAPELAPPRGHSNATAIFEVADIRAVRARLIRRGVSFVGKVTEVGTHGWFATFRDPEGNEVSLWQPRRGARAPSRGTPRKAATRSTASAKPAATGRRRRRAVRHENRVHSSRSRRSNKQGTRRSAPVSKAAIVSPAST